MQSIELQAQLQDAPDNHAPGQGFNRWLEPALGKCCHQNEADIQKYRREGGNGEMAPSVQNAGREGHHRHKEDIEKGNTRQDYG